MGVTISFYGCDFLFVRYIFGGNFVLKSHVGSSSFVRCRESRSVRFSEVAFSITTMLISIRNTELVRCREVVRFSEGPLSEARLYIYRLYYM